MIKSIAIEAIVSASTSPCRPFFTERDFVWICQKEITKLINLNMDISLLYKVYQEYPILGQTISNTRIYYADLAIISTQNGEPLSMLEFKYEPNHSRNEILKSKQPVVTMNGIKSDLNKISAILQLYPNIHWCFILFDEANYFKEKSEAIYSHCRSLNLECDNILIINDPENN